VDSTPAVSNVSPDNYFDVAFSDFTYSLDGSPVAITPIDIRFFSASQFGMFEICFTTACSFFDNPANGFVFIGDQMYTGSESAPSMLTGTFTSEYAYAFADTTQIFLKPTQTIQAVSTPEPSALQISVAGFLLMAAGRFRRRRKNSNALSATSANSVARTLPRHSACPRTLCRWRWLAP
jgi:hypothetical protein